LGTVKKMPSNIIHIVGDENRLSGNVNRRPISFPAQNQMDENDNKNGFGISGRKK